MRRAFALTAALCAWLVPTMVLACPQCAGRQNGGTLAMVGLGGLLLLPFVAAGIVITIIRAHLGDDGEGGPRPELLLGGAGEAVRRSSIHSAWPLRALGAIWQHDRKRRQPE